MVRSDRSSWLGSFSAVMTGLVLVFAGFAALGWWLAAAGRGAVWQAAPGIAAIVCFAVGFTLLALAVKRRSGLMRWRPTRRELETYRTEYRRR